MDGSWMTDVHTHAKQGDVGGVRRAVQHGVSVDERDQHGNTLAHHAALHGHVNVLRYLRDSGADMEGRNMEGYRPAHWAVLSGHVNALRFLREEAGADMDVENINRHTPLVLAKVSRQQECVDYLTSPVPSASEQEEADLWEALDERLHAEADEYKCAVCLDLSLEPWMCDRQGHGVCRACSIDLRECPQRCGATSFVADPRGARRVRGMSCRCALGCGWTGVLKDAASHGGECGKRVVQCNACGASMEKAALQEHSSRECPSRLVACSQCNDSVALLRMEQHVASMHVACVVPGCDFVGAAQVMAQHLADEGDRHWRGVAEKLCSVTEQAAATERRLEEELGSVRELAERTQQELAQLRRAVQALAK